MAHNTAVRLRLRMSRKAGIGVLATVVVVAVAGLAYYELMKAGFIRYNKYDRRERGSLKVGGQSPDLDLTMYDGSSVRLSQLWGAQPVFVVFGSCT
jgi:hypothetical protein